MDLMYIRARWGWKGLTSHALAYVNRGKVMLHTPSESSASPSTWKLRTKSERIGKKGGGPLYSTPKYFAARLPSNGRYFALAGIVNGGLLPVASTRPPRKMGWNLEG